MQDRKEERTSVRWGKHGFIFGSCVGAGAGGINYRMRKITWENHLKKYPQPNSWLRPVPTNFLLPMIGVTVFAGGLGYAAGKIYQKTQYPKQQSTLSKPEKWANNGFKVGAGAGILATLAVDYAESMPLSLGKLAKTSAGVGVMGGLFCAGVGLFTGIVADKLKKDNLQKLKSQP